MILWLKQSDTCVIPVSMVVYWMMILWLKQSDTCQWWFKMMIIPGNENKVIPVSMVVYWMMILWLKQSDTCVNGGLLNDDTLIKTKWYLEIKTKWYLCQWWFIE